MGVAAEGLGLARVEHLDATGDGAVPFEDPAVPAEVGIDLEVAPAEPLVHPGSAGGEPLLGRGVGGGRVRADVPVKCDNGGDVGGGGGAEGEPHTMPRRPPPA